HLISHVIDVGAEAHEVLSINPRERVRALDSSFPNLVEDAEVVSEEKFIRDIEVRLTAHAREVVVPACVLTERRIHDVAAHLRRDRADQRLIAQEYVVSAAGSADSAAVQCGTHELVQIARVLYVVAQQKLIARAQLVIYSDNAVV